MTTVAAVLAGLVLLAGAIKAAPVVGRFFVGCCAFVVAAAKAPLIIQAMVKEFSPNGGSSLRDGIDRLDHRLDAHVAESDRKHDETIRALSEFADLRDVLLPKD